MMPIKINFRMKEYKNNKLMFTDISNCASSYSGFWSLKTRCVWILEGDVGSIRLFRNCVWILVGHVVSMVFIMAGNTPYTRFIYDLSSIRHVLWDITVSFNVDSGMIIHFSVVILYPNNLDIYLDRKKCRKKSKNGRLALLIFFEYDYENFTR